MEKEMTNLKKDEKKKVVCVLSMHRSGSSMITRILNFCGLYIGEEKLMHPASPYNELGYWENKEVIEINKEILKLFGGSSKNPPNFPNNWHEEKKLDELYERARYFVSKMNDSSRIWGLKEPRMCLTLPFWKKLIPEMIYVIPFRRSIEVAKSLQRRDGLPLEKGIFLWLLYWQNILDNTENDKRIITLQQEYFINWKIELGKIINFINDEDFSFKGKEKVIEKFISPKLLHFKCDYSQKIKLRERGAENFVIWKFILEDLQFSIGESRKSISIEISEQKHTKNIKKLEAKLKNINNSKSFRIGDLFFRSLKSPFKWLTFPINFIKILLDKRVNPGFKHREAENKKYCVLCNKINVFNNAGELPRVGVKCPLCGSLERHRFLYYIYKILFLNDRRDIKLLHMAPEASIFNVLSTRQNIDYTAADIEPKQYNFTNCLKENFTNLSFEDGKFDIILSNHVLEHISEEEKALAEMRRVLSDDGFIILSIPYKKCLRKTFEDARIVKEEDRRKFFGQEDHVRVYGSDIINRLEKVDFIVNQISDNVFPKYFVRHNALENFNKKSGFSCGFFILRKKSEK